MDNTSQILQIYVLIFFIYELFLELMATSLIYFYMETFCFSAVRGEKNHVKIRRNKETFPQQQVGP